jgi:hypothetical protein
MSDASSTESRFKRPELPRSEPRRSFSGVFGPGIAPPTAADGVKRGVDLGYRVIEDYLRQGQTAARGMFDGSPAQAGDASERDPQRLAERMIQYASDLAAVWFEYVRVVGGPRPAAAGPAAASGETPPFDIEPPAPVPPSPLREARPDPSEAFPATRIALALTSKQPTEVIVDLKPGSAALALSAHDLRARDAGIPRIAGVVIATDPAADLVKIQIAVPDDQPLATYTGVILDDATNLPRGTLSLRVIG